MGGSNHGSAHNGAPKNHTWKKKHLKLVAGAVAVCAALSVSGMAFAAAGGGTAVSWDAMEKEQPPVPIEQTESADPKDDVLPATGASAPAKADGAEKPGDAAAEAGAKTTGDEPAGKTAEPEPAADPVEPEPAVTPAEPEPQPEEPAPSTEEQEPAVASVRLSVEPADRATVSCDGAVYRSGDSFQTEAPAAFALTVAAAEGFEVESVTVIRTAAPLEGAAAATAPGSGEARALEPDAAGAYVVEADGESATYQVSVTLRDARINTYENLKAALEQGGMVKLEGDVAAEGPLTVAADTTLDLAGHVLSLPEGSTAVGAADSLITVKAGAALTVTDSAAPARASQCRAEEVGVQASSAAKLATYDAATRELTYYVTTTKTNRSAGTTRETRHEEHLSLAGSGAIEASGIDALVAVEDGAALVVDGGLLTNAGGAHGVKAGNAEVTITGSAAIVGSGNASASGDAANGAGVYQAAGTLTVSGSAVIAGNEAASSGGGIYLAAGSATIAGDAIIAGNRASTGDPKDDSANSHEASYNGGGVYVSQTASLTVSDQVVISGNSARRDGGGIYVQPKEKNPIVPATRLVITGGTITNNRSVALKTGGFYISGGGGIFSMGDTVIDGAVITSNRAADSGGGLCMPGEDKYQMPTLAMTNTVVAANYTGASEGGGMFCMTAGKDKTAGRTSYVTTGTYITNNHTATEFDYGGGGLFVPSDGFLNVVYPVVTGNEAHGLGGGVAACSNSTVITQDAAIFDNKALGENHTSNPNEYGDRWAMLTEDKGPGPKGDNPGDRVWDMTDKSDIADEDAAYDAYYDYRVLKHVAWQNEDGTVEPLEADDFFSANRATVYGTMLGGHDATCPENCADSHRAEYDWTGWMSASPAEDVAQVTYRGYSSGNGGTIELPSGEKVDIKSALPRANGLGWYLWVQKKEFDDVQAEELARSLDGLGVNFTYTAGAQKNFSSQLTGFYAQGLQEQDGLICLDFKRYADGGYLQNADGTSANNGGLYTKADGSKLAPRELEAATRTDPLAFYRVYYIKKFPEGDGFAHANRIMALTAHPSSEAKVSARAAACVFVTGNTSNTNGGGIGCNGFMHIGRPDANVPDQPVDKDDPTHFGSFRIAKTVEGFPEGEDGVISAGRATAVFHVVGYRDEASFDGGGVHNVIYDAYHALEFDANETQELVLGRFPVGSFFTITEVSYSGANSAIAGGEGAVRTVTVTANDDTAEDAVLPVVNFVNAYREDGHHSTGVVNTYTKQDGAYTVTQKWSKTQVVVAAPEGEDPADDQQAPADES